MQRENRPFLLLESDLIPFVSDCRCYDRRILVCSMATTVSWRFWKDFLNAVRLMGGDATVLWILVVCMWWLALLQPSCGPRYYWHLKDGKGERWKQSGSLKMSLSCRVYFSGPWSTFRLLVVWENNPLIVHAAFRWLFFQLTPCGSLSPRIRGSSLQENCTYSSF